MSMLLWNCRGARHPNFVRTVRELAGMHGPDIMVITETRARGEDVRHIIDRLPFDSWKDTATIGYKRGIWFLWKSDLVEVDDICATEQEIHATIKVKSNNFSWLISAIYASPCYKERLLLWENLKTVPSHHDLPWLVLGDFNEVLNIEDKKGGRPVSLVGSGAFKDCLNFCHLADLGFSGPSSDHCPILLSLKNKVPRVGLKPFCLQKMWFDHPEFLTLVRNSWSNGQESLAQSLLTLRKDMHEWNLNSFGNFFLKKKKILARWSGIEKALANSPNQFLLNLQRTLLEEFNGILKAGEDIWILKSRVNWLIEGERNTRFFHVFTILRRRYNRISGLMKDGVWISEPNGPRFLHEAIYFFLLSNLPYRHSWTLIYLEIQKTFWSFKSFKASGPNGLHPFFYHRCWNIVKDKICATVKHIFEVASMLEELNETLIFLVPKCINPTQIDQFRLISLCNIPYKIISKIMVQRLRLFLDKMISPFQASFVPGRNGCDNCIIIQELVHSFKTKKGGLGHMIVKLDLEKAYDKLEWGFIRKVLTFFNLPKSWISLIMSCVSSSSISILMNEGMLKKFKPSRGKAEGKTANSMQEVLIAFCDEFGQTINLEKFGVFFFTNTRQDYKRDIINILGINETLISKDTWGFPMRKGRVSKNDYAFIVNKVKAKLVGWKTNLLSPTGRMGKNGDKKRLHLLNWSEVTKKKVKVDWVTTLKGKYLQDNGTLRKTSKVSMTWKAMKWAGPIVEKDIGWVIGDGSSTSFWHDNWLGFGSLKNIVHGPLNWHEDQISMSQCLNALKNNQPLSISFKLNANVLDKINAIPTQLVGQGQDNIYWSASSSGVFTTQSAYDLDRGTSLNENKGQWEWI
ncbi:uncharacterized protein LOC111301045 [Durio zibethinus]|uniref:Uncharacterized protein LOC111301045 n=1 Tax=Durio zibethinus TaxID=66656 RepID=A0A6P5ZIJ8_DURZI|nr:uncharacterized protein LOC111301045 [Durio zibethinus]